METKHGPNALRRKTARDTGPGMVARKGIEPLTLGL